MKKNIIITIISILLIISPTMVVSGDVNSPQEILRDNLKLKKRDQPIQHTSVGVLQREIKRLNSLIIDLKVERDNWRERASAAENVDTEQVTADSYYDSYLIVVYFETLLLDAKIKFPNEMVQYKQDLVTELGKLGYEVGDE